MSIQESKTAVENFIAQYGLTYPFLLDTTGDASRSYNVYTTPTTYFVNPDGIITDILPGVMSQRWIDQKMAGLSG